MPNGVQHCAILVFSSALEDQWTVNPAISTHNKADAYLGVMIRATQQRVGRGQSFRRLCNLTSRICVRTQDVGKLRFVHRWFPPQIFA